jgi:hypothetical protein
MSNQPPDTPQVQIEMPSPLGGRYQQQVSVQSNRQDPAERFRWAFLNALALPASLVDLSIDAVTYTLTAALLISVVIQLWELLDVLLFGMLLWIVFSGLVVLTYSVCRAIQGGWILLIYRAALVAAGVAVGVWL